MQSVYVITSIVRWRAVPGSTNRLKTSASSRRRAFPQRSAEGKRAAWQHAHCNRLKHDPGVLDAVIAEAAQPIFDTSLRNSH